MEYRQGMKNGWVVVTFWVLSSTIGGIRIQAYLNEDGEDSTIFVFVVLQFLVATAITINALIFNDGTSPDLIYSQV